MSLIGIGHLTIWATVDGGIWAGLHSVPTLSFLFLFHACDSLTLWNTKPK